MHFRTNLVIVRSGRLPRIDKLYLSQPIFVQPTVKCILIGWNAMSRDRKQPISVDLLLNFFTSLPPVGGNDLTMLKIFIGSNKLTNYLIIIIIIIIIIASFTIRDCLRFVIFANASKFPLLFKHTISVTRLFFSKSSSNIWQLFGRFCETSLVKKRFCGYKLGNFGK